MSLAIHRPRPARQRAVARDSSPRRRVRREAPRAALALILAGPWAVSATLAEDRWFLGAELLATEHRFEIDVDYTYGRASESFLDQARGLGGSLIGGRRIALTPTWSLAAQGRITFNEPDWSLATPRTSVRYRMPHGFALSLLPEYQLTPSLSAFGEIGAAFGQFEYRKTSSDPSRVTRYDETNTAAGYVLGVGMRYALTPRLGIHATYRYSDYQSHDFLGRLSDGSVREIFTSDPSTQDIGVGFRWLW